VAGYDWRPGTSRASTTTAPQAVASPRDAGTVASVVDDFVRAAETGRAVNRSGRSYRPSALRDVRGILRYHVVPDLGHVALRDVRRQDIQALVDRLARQGLSESRIRSVISALRALYGYAIQNGQAEVNPADTLEMRAVPPPAEPPEWEDPPPPRPRERWRPDDVPREPRQEPKRRDRDRTAYQPIAYLPDRILSLALRVALVVFVLIALVSLVSAMGPA
jgi:Phage integrase, N-terminal SAM-like domain